MSTARIGCSGWQYRDWRGPVYPPGLGQARWLGRYAELFDTVEVNATFYRLARRDAVARWVEQTPPGFSFAVKASRYLTHVRRLREIEEGIGRFLAPLEPLADSGRLGPVLWQLPANFPLDADRLAAALRLLSGFPPTPHAWEFRHPSWFCSEVYGLLHAHDCALVLAHDARRELPAHVATADWSYVRFHFGARGRGGNYSRAELAAWAERLAPERRLWAYFNNDWNAYAPRNALALRRELARG